MSNGGSVYFQLYSAEAQLLCYSPTVDRFNSLAFMAYNESDLKSLLASQIEQGIYTQQEVDNLLGEVDQYKNTINHVPPNMSAKAASTIFFEIPSD